MLRRPGHARLASVAGVIAAGLLALLAPTGASAAPEPIAPGEGSGTTSAPTASTSATPAPTPSPSTSTVSSSVSQKPAAQPDRVDRSWPRHPPWDACPRPVWPGTASTGAPGQGRRVLMIGDSLTRDSRVTSTRLMRKSGWTPTFRCWGSTRLDWGLAQVARSRQIEQLPGFVIMALGTNDISWETPQTTERRLRTLLDRLGPRRQVLWVDLHLTRSAWLNARADWFNGLLRRLERTHRNLTVVGWHKVARAHGIRGWDGIHYGPSGYVLRARTVAAALDAVGRRHPAAASTARPEGATATTGSPAPTSTTTPSAAPTPSPTTTVIAVPGVSPASGSPQASPSAAPAP